MQTPKVTKADQHDNVATYPRYPAYKDSGVEWIGEVPAHWEMLANKYIFKLKKNLVGKRHDEYDLLSLTLKGIIKRDMEKPEGKFPAEFDSYQKVNVGDFVFCLFDVEETPRTVGLSSWEGMITGAYTVLESGGAFDSKYLYYFYLNLDTDKRLKPLYRGLRNTIPKEKFFSFKTFIPPRPEQTKIAAFLDQKTAQIDRAIAQKERLIELLRERRQVLIHRAVTKGLNPEVEMRDSGVEWIGEIPAHWEVRRLGTLGRFAKGGGISRADLASKGLPAILYGDIYTKYDIQAKELVNSITKETAKRAVIIGKGDLLFTGSGETLEEIGKCILYDGDTTAYSGGDIIILKSKGQNNLYLSYTLNSEGVIAEKAKLSKGEIVVHIYASKLKYISLPIPPSTEQKEISIFLSKQSDLITNAVKKKTIEIAKLKELKSTLINAAVTGQIKV